MTGRNYGLLKTLVWLATESKGIYCSSQAVCEGMWVNVQLTFVVAAFTEWNKLPQAVTTQDSVTGFRQQLKIFLFPSIVFSPIGF